MLSSSPLVILPPCDTDSSSSLDKENDQTVQLRSINDDQENLISEQELFRTVDTLVSPDIDDLFTDNNDTIVPDSTDKLDEDMQRLETMRISVSKYLDKNISPLNISCHSHSIHRDIMSRDTAPSIHPTLELYMIVHDGVNELEDDRNAYSTKASAVLLRFVNSFPLMDSPEACACGLYHAMIENRNVWNSFGIELKPAQESGHEKRKKQKVGNVFDSNYEEASKEISKLYRCLHIPSYDLYDTALMSAFLKQNDAAHGLFRDSKNEIDKLGTTSFENTVSGKHQKGLLPIGGRLGNILVIAKLKTKARDVSFPSLSKVSSS
jgi:hypothetical protein